MKKIVNFTLITLLLATFLAGCQNTATPTAAISVTDGLERTVSLAETAQRIVSLAPSVTETLFAIGAGDLLVGRDSFSDYPEEALAIQDVGGSMGEYSLETIASLNPDLVIATELNTPELVDSIENLGLTVYYIKNPTNLDELYPVIETMGALTGHEDEAVELNASLKARVQAVVDVIAGAESRPVVFYELDCSDTAKPWTSGPGTFMDQLIQMAGGTNAGSAMQSAWAQISLEELLVQNPEVILLGDAAYGCTVEGVPARPGWEGMQAVVANQVYAINDDLVSLPGPRLVDGLEEIARLIHPELYQ